MRLIASAVIVSAVALFAILALTGRPLPAPSWVVTEIEGRVNAALGGAARVSLAGAEAIVDQGFVPRVRLTGVEIFSPSGARLAVVEDVRASLAPGALAGGRVAPRSVRMSGVTISLTRLPDGSIDLPRAASGEARPLTPAGALDALDAAFENPALAGIGRIEVERADIRLTDRRSGRSWAIEDGRLTLRQTGDSLAIALGMDLTGPGSAPARAEIDFASRKRSPEARIEARVTGVPARDLAAQSPALAWLDVIDAPISGRIRTGVDENGAVRQTVASLSIGAGVLKPGPATEPVRFEGAQVDLDYDPASGQLGLTELSFRSRALALHASGKGWLSGTDGGMPDALVAQIAISDLRADPRGLFQNPVAFSQGALDLKLELDPFRLHLGQVALIDQGRRISARGDVAAGPEGWNVALDLDIDAIASDRLIALWPVQLVPRTRAWLEENVATAELFDLKAAFRLRPGAEPRVSLGYEYRDADVRFLPSLPPIRGGAGYATIHDNAYVLVIDKGYVTAPLGGRLDVAGSVLEVPDIGVKPAPAEITLRSDSSITAALSILDEPPFRFLTKAERPVDAAEGRARVEAVLNLPLKKGVQPGEVSYLVAATLTDVRSDTLVPGRPLRADELSLHATPQGLEISGDGTLAAIPFRATWRQKFGPDERGRSSVEGTVELSPEALDAFQIALPPGSVGGRGRGVISIALAKGEPARFTLGSDLAGLSLKVPGLAWTKPRDASGTLEVTGTFGMPGRPANIERLALDAPGLSAEGSVSLRDDGSLDAVALSSVAIGDWFDGAVRIEGRGRGSAPAIRIAGGTADMRRARFAEGSGGTAGPPIEVALDRLVVSQGIALTDFRGDFTSGGGLTGGFVGLVNGEAPLSGDVVPVDGRSAFRLRSGDAGAVFRAAGIFTRGRGGEMDLTLRPVGTAGLYAGAVEISSIRVVDAPVLAELLGAISVIGLLEQLNGSGILFSDVEGEFLLTPEAVEIQRGSAVGASLGVSAKGVYYSAAKELDLAGTISPIYVINVIGRPFTKQREGLFGFNYRLRGPAAAPRVTVNPLSILTPGMFRELFRAPPPRLRE